jgi:drug/metabolite transporter (DMT)-like permease
MLALSPVISAFLSLGLSGKPIPPPGWLGIFLITIGLYILLAGPRATRGSFKDSVVRIFSDPGTLAMLGVAIVTSVSVYVGQYTISHSSRIFYAFSMNLTSAIGLLAIALPLKKIDRSFFHKEKIKKFLTMGTANAGMTLSLAVALGATSAAYALSLKRTNIIWSALMGRMIFGEKLDARKIIAIGITFIGILLIIL